MLRFFVERGLMVNLISIFLVLLGLFAMVAINREAFPNVNLDLVQIDTVYPGATPEEIERLVITPIEQELKALNGIDKMISVAYPGSGRITLELDPNASNRGRIVSDASLAVDRAELPRDLPDEPTVLEIDGAVFSVVNLAVSAPRSALELKRLGDRIRDDLLELPGVARVWVQGDRKAEIRVTVDPARLARERVSVGEIAAALAAWNVNAPGGDLKAPDGQKAVRIVGEFRSAPDAANLVLRANEWGGGLRLADVATVTESLEEPRIIYDVAGEPALAMIVMKKIDADIISTVDAVFKYVETVPRRYGEDVRVDSYQDFSRFARLRLGVLTNNAMVGVFLVFGTLILFLRPSVALTTTWGLPIVFLAGLFALYSYGITLNLISMMGFIIVLGMLVDDAIMVGENITYHMERGMKPREAAVHGTYELIGPVTATVMTTIVAFMPLMFMTGMIGKFVIAIPIVVITLLFLSWLEAFLILPSHVADFTHPHRHPPERKWLVRFEEGYGRLLESALKHRYLTVLLSFVILIGSLALARFAMNFQLFPPVGVDQFLVRVTASPGTTIETMQSQLIAIDKEIRARVRPEHLETTLLTSGEISIDQGDPLTQRGARYGQIRVIYLPAVTRPDHDALDDMYAVADVLPPMFAGVDIAFTEVRPGPPTGRPLEVEIAGSHDGASEAAARRLLVMLEKVEGVTSVDSGLKPGDNELHVVVDRALATYAGVDLATAAQHVRAAVGGLVVGTTRRGTEEIDITIRYPEGGVDQLAQLKGLQIPNQRGGLVPLARIAELKENPGFNTVRHKAGIRVVNVVADINTDVITSLALNRLVMDQQDEWVGDAAGQVQVGYGGEEEKNRESFLSLLVALVFALVGIFFILAIQFNSLGYPLVVMLAIPFGAIGIILSFYVHDLLWKPMPLSFFSTMGMVALSGVVINSALVLLVFVQRAMREGVACKEAIVQAGRRRLRAVVLTATTTVVGLLPTAYGWGGMDPFVSPMALALSWGLIFATLITLVTIPATLATALDIKAWLKKQFARA
ncbi:MAG TPA: efflux RND transporter permease subunit [Acidiferrobacterales bacterium]